jgi:VIT1/CCC1 family predicted Fe2+/Mn2+ transporter
MNHWMNQTQSTHIELSSPEDVKQVIGSVSRLMTLVTLKVSSGLIPGNEISTWQARIDNHLAACGCKQSTLGMVFLALLYAIFYFLGSGELSGIGATELLSCAAFSVVGAAIGKLGGVVYARIRLKRTLEALLSVSQNREIDRWDERRASHGI